ncbi:hypothetical protein [Botrimarina hoheduenensis]|uniref:Uncharacterized protein n=1 Tax=Botrimarina hoheduenensis TaxID=2528000 RepID=A0A5C5W0A3_9BACT|nr:hypothetical protein [Botrimarina hoheduenensis]TWT43479.1 hypothetical protein Pla111_24300 [Botrimarina hoheduenensis]
MSQYRSHDQPEIVFFTDIEQAALDGAYVATTKTPFHDIELARVGFPVERLVIDHGRSGYQEVELDAFSLRLSSPERNTRRVNRETLDRDWIVLPAYCHKHAHLLWERVTREVPGKGSTKRRLWRWFTTACVDPLDGIDEKLLAQPARDSIRDYLLFSLSARIELLRRQPSHREAFAERTCRAR